MSSETHGSAKKKTRDNGKSKDRESQPTIKLPLLGCYHSEVPSHMSMVKS